MITHNIDLALVELDVILKRTLDFVPFFDFAGEHALEAIRKRILDTKVSPDGEDWAPWKPLTETMRTWKGNAEQGLLFDTGDLLNSMRVEVDGSFSVAIGTDIPYAVDLQDGIPGKQEAREFVGWEADDVFVLGRTAITYLSTGVLQ